MMEVISSFGIVHVRLILTQNHFRVPVFYRKAII